MSIDTGGATLAAIGGARSVSNAVRLFTSNAIVLGGTNALTLSGDMTVASGNRTLTVSNTALTTLSGNIYLSDSAGTGRTLTIGGAGNLLVSGMIANVAGGSGAAGNLVVNAGGTRTLTGNNTYTGTTTVAGTLSLQASSGAALANTSGVIVNGGQLQLGAANQVNDAALVTLNGGTFSLGGFSETVGALTLQAGSTINFGGTGATLDFANSSANTWTGTLTLQNFTVGSDFLNFGTAAGLTVAQLADLSLGGYTATGLDGSGNVLFTAAPEPSSSAFVLVGLAALAWRGRRALAFL